VPLPWPSSWGASTPPRRSWTRPGRRCAKPSPATGSACRPATPRPCASARSTPPASAPGGRPRQDWTRCSWRSTLAPSQPGRGRRLSCTSGSAVRSSTPPWAPVSCRALQRKPLASAHHPRVGDHPTGRPQPPAGRPTHQPRRPPLSRPHRSGRPHQPIPPTRGAGVSGRCPLTFTAQPAGQRGAVPPRRPLGYESFEHRSAACSPVRKPAIYRCRCC
jgi:hypothetical protein